MLSAFAEWAVLLAFLARARATFWANNLSAKLKIYKHIQQLALKDMLGALFKAPQRGQLINTGITSASCMGRIRNVGCDTCRM